MSTSVIEWVVQKRENRLVNIVFERPLHNRFNDTNIESDLADMHSVYGANLCPSPQAYMHFSSFFKDTILSQRPR